MKQRVRNQLLLFSNGWRQMPVMGFDKLASALLYVRGIISDKIRSVDCNMRGIK
ncbi:hypothetical protein JCM12296A_33720 [Desulfosarcina cetonica]|uniref:Uncharacterized protein n=1 Tax=Desulfosarcina ovata subsp. ovata TaxID=2752305 RepID=A0A5K8AJ60_9BACT|nr:hypothetical protein DSCOOX_59150 [Desulfosarcina ovata subsp. ovata]